MSSHDFDRRYRLLKVVAQADGVRTHNAQEITTGRVVMVHLLDDAGPDVVDAMGRRLARLPDAEKTRVLETATLPAGFAVVTDFIPGLQSFSDWLTARVAREDTPRETPPRVGFQSVPQLIVPPLAASDRSPVPAAPPQQAAGSDENVITAESALPDSLGRDTDADPPKALEFTVGGAGSAGEFTRMFMASGRLNIETTPAAPPAPTPAPAPAPVQPQLEAPVQAPVPVPAPVAAQAPQAPPTPGLFTQMFGAAAPATPLAPSQPEPQASAPAPIPPAAPAPPRASEPAPAAPSLAPGEFTRMFQAGTPAPLAGASASPLVGAAPVQQSIPAPLPPAFPPASGPAFTAAPAVLPPSAPLPPLQGGATGALAARMPPPPQPSAARGEDALAAFGGLGGGAGFGAAFGGGSLPSSQPAPAPPPPPPPPSGASPLAPMITPPAFRMPGDASLRGGGDSLFGGGASAPAAGGSEYTRMIRQSATPAPPPVTPAPPKPALAPTTPKASLPLPLIVAINVVVLLAVGLVLYFVLRPTPPAAVQGAVPSVAVPGAVAPAAAPPAGASPASGPPAASAPAPTTTPPTAR